MANFESRKRVVLPSRDQQIKCHISATDEDDFYIVSRELGKSWVDQDQVQINILIKDDNKIGCKVTRLKTKSNLTLPS